MTSSPGRLLFSVEEVAAHLNLHVKTVRRYIQNGRLKATRVGKSYRIKRSDLDAFAGPGHLDADPISRTRQITASTIVDIEAISPEESSRLTTMLLAGLNGRSDDGEEVPRLDTIYYPDRGRLRVVITAGPNVTADLLRSVTALLEHVGG